MSKSKKVKMPKMDDIYQQIAQERLTKAEAAKVNAKALFDTLSETKIASIVVEFDGCGDSGQITNVDYYDHRNKDQGEPQMKVKGSFVGRHHEWDDKQKKFVEVGGGEGGVRDIIEEVCYNKLSASHMGWEINEGSYGTFTFDVLDRKIELEFNERVESVRTTSEKF